MSSAGFSRFLRRLLWIIPILALEMTYFPIKQIVSGGVAPALWLDAYIPIWPIWGVPYLLVFGWWTFGYVWATVCLNDENFRNFSLSGLIIFSITAATFVLFPTYVNRPELTGQGLDWDLLRFIYGNDTIYNALPSMHISTTMWITLHLVRQYPRKGWLFWGIFGIVALSTLFTRQHYLLDVAAGALLAWASLPLAGWLNRLLSPAPQPAPSRAALR